jgi:hypothetical protein
MENLNIWLKNFGISTTVDVLAIIFCIAVIYSLGDIIKCIKFLITKMDKIEEKIEEVANKIDYQGDRIETAINVMHDDLMTDADRVRSAVRLGIPEDVAWEHVYTKNTNTDDQED